MTLGAAIGGLIACVSLGPKTPPARYALEASFDGQPAAGSGPTLVVAVPTAAPGFDGPRIVYVRKPHELEFFARNEWVDSPARMLGPLLVQALEHSGRFQAVAETGTVAAAGLRLESTIVRLQHEFTVRPSRVRLTVRVQLADVPSRRVLGAREFEAVEEAPSDDPYGGVVAANRAARRVLEDIVNYCVEASARFGGFSFDPCVDRDPVHFPGLAPIVREGLLEAAGIRSDVRDHESNEDRSAVQGFLGEELAASILELTDRRWAQDPAGDARKIEAPLAGFGVVQTQAQRPDVACRPIDVELHQIGATVPDLSNDGGTFVFDPGPGPGQGTNEARQASFPGADLEVEVVLPISRRRSSSSVRSRRV